MRVDLVGVGGPAGERRRLRRECHPVGRLGDELRRLLPGSAVDVHVWSDPPASLFRGPPPDLAQACARSAPLVDELRERWRAERPDVVHADCWISGLAALRAARPLEIPVVAARWSGGRSPWEAGPVPGDDVDLRLCLSADLVVAHDDEDLAKLHRHGVARHVARLPVGVDLAGLDAPGDGWFTETLDGAGPPRAAAPRMAGRVVSVLDASTLGSLPTVLDVVDRRWGHREVVLLAPCGAPTGSATAAYLRSPVVSRLLAPLLGAISRAVERGVRVTVEPARDPVRRFELLRSAALFVYPADGAPSARAVVEAMAAGCLVISSGTGRLAGLVEDGVTGLVAAEPDRDALTAALAAGSHPDVAGALGRRAATVAAERYAWPAVATQARDLYKTVLGGG